eukprot:6214650-Pleurochrysis_carterae.AAC.2
MEGESRLSTSRLSLRVAGQERSGHKGAEEAERRASRAAPAPSCPRLWLTAAAAVATAAIATQRFPAHPYPDTPESRRRTQARWYGN